MEKVQTGFVIEFYSNACLVRTKDADIPCIAIKNIVVGDIVKIEIIQDSKEIKSQKLIESATRQVKRAIFNFKCGKCGNISGKWTDNCSSCNTFDTLECLSRIN